MTVAPSYLHCVEPIPRPLAFQPDCQPTPGGGGGGGGGGGTFFYAKDFGAKGDNATDNTPHVTAALKAAYTANGVSQ